MKLKLWMLGVLAASATLACADELKWSPNYASALKQAKASKKIVMIDFTAVWCVNCHKLDRVTYKDASVVKMLGSAVAVKVDTDKEQAIAKKYGVEALPVILFADANGKEIGRILGYWDGKAFIQKATPILKKAKK